MKIICRRSDGTIICDGCFNKIREDEPELLVLTGYDNRAAEKIFHPKCFTEYLPLWVDRSCEYAQKIKEEKGPIVRQSKYPVDKRQAIYAINSKISYHKRHGHEDKVRTLSAMRNNLINGKEAVEVIRKYPIEHREAIYNLRRLQHYHRKMENYDKVDEIEATIQGMIMEKSNGH